MFVPAFVVSQFFVHTAVAELSPAAVSRAFIERYVGCSRAVLMLVLTVVRTLRYPSISVISRHVAPHSVPPSTLSLMVSCE